MAPRRGGQLGPWLCRAQSPRRLCQGSRVPGLDPRHCAGECGVEEQPKLLKDLPQDTEDLLRVGKGTRECLPEWEEKERTLMTGTPRVSRNLSTSRERVD